MLLRMFFQRIKLNSDISPLLVYVVLIFPTRSPTPKKKVEKKAVKKAVKKEKKVKKAKKEVRSATESPVDDRPSSSMYLVLHHDKCLRYMFDAQFEGFFFVRMLTKPLERTNIFTHSMLLCN